MDKDGVVQALFSASQSDGEKFFDVYHDFSMKVVSHIPHSSLIIPEDVRGQFLLIDEELWAEQQLMTDHFTDELFREAVLGVTDVIFQVSRLVVDPERFADDADEPMASIGMGVIYGQTSDGKTLRREISESERQQLIERYYRPHHHRLHEAVREAVHFGERCLVLDCHSFPTRSLPYELHQNMDRLEICIGTDAFHTPDKVADLAVRTFQDAGFSVAVNEPFAGALVPSKCYQSDDRVLALMIEVRRDLYMDESTCQKTVAFDLFQQRLRTCIRKIVAASDD